MKRFLSVPALILLGMTITVAGTLRAQTSAKKPTTTAQKPSQPKFKAIWEPMNYPDDISLQSVYFVDDKVGWVSGAGSSKEGGFIFHSADGGEHWDVQLGDPHSNDLWIDFLQFLDATHGWARQGGNTLLRTTDGKNWETVGPFAAITAYRFLSVQNGFTLTGDYTGSAISVTSDGGRSWKPIYQCVATLQVNGLTRKVGCYLRDLHFPSNKVGYAVGGGFSDPWAAIVKTVDGGATWKVIYASTDVPSASAVFFTDENNGVVRAQDGRVLITADGGESWRGAIGTAYPFFKFADSQVGWSCDADHQSQCSYTVNGGGSWTTRSFNFPTKFLDYSMPRRDRIYVVGDHGMIYRYRIVPADYTTKGMIEAPMMPAASANQDPPNESQPNDNPLQFLTNRNH
jgi:photosystem II stability/assembly factor-like uncharacterized protein